MAHYTLGYLNHTTPTFFSLFATFRFAYHFTHEPIMYQLCAHCAAVIIVTHSPPECNAVPMFVHETQVYCTVGVNM